MWKLVLIFNTIFIACKPDRPLRFGLDEINLHIDQKNISQLNSTVFAKPPVTGLITIKGVKGIGDISYAGKSTIDAHKKSYDLVFHDTEFLRRKAWRLSAQVGDPSFLRSLLGFRIYSEYGVKSPIARPYAMFLNHEFMGLYALLELVDEDFVTHHFGFQDQSLMEFYKAKFGNADLSTDILNNIKWAFSIDGYDNSATALKQLILAIHAKDLVRIEELIDVEAALTYLAVTVLMHHWDGFDNNYILMRSGKEPFRIIPWDLDRAFEPESAAFPYHKDDSIWGKNELFRYLVTVPSLRQNYLGILKSILVRSQNGALWLEWAKDYKTKIQEAYQADRTLSRYSLEREFAILSQAMMRWIQLINQELQTL